MKDEPFHIPPNSKSDEDGNGNGILEENDVQDHHVREEKNESRLDSKSPGRRNQGRRTKSLDISMISRPTRLHCPSTCSTSSGSTEPRPSSSFTSENLKDGQKSSIQKNRAEKQSKDQNDRDNDLSRPRSKSVSVLSSSSSSSTATASSNQQKPRTPSILLTTIAEASEETTSQSISPPHSPKKTNTLVLAGSDLEQVNCTERTDNEKCTSVPLFVIPELYCKAEDTLQKTSASNRGIILDPSGITDCHIRPTSTDQHQEKVRIEESRPKDQVTAKNDEDINEDDWEVVSLRKRRKSSRYQPVSFSLSNTLFGDTTVSAVSLKSARFEKASPLLVERNDDENHNDHASKRKRTKSFRAITYHLGRTLPRYRRASANDIEVSQIKHSSHHLVHFQHHPEIEGQTNPRRVSISSLAAGDDSGFASSLHEQSIYSNTSSAYSSATYTTTSTPPSSSSSKYRRNGMSSSNEGIPQIPALTLVSPMGTLRRYISCPDSILNGSPTKNSQVEQKKIHRPLPVLPDSIICTNISTEVGGSPEHFSPALPPLPRFASTAFAIEDDAAEHSVISEQSISRLKTAGDNATLPSASESTSQEKRKSIRRKSLISNLRSVRQLDSSTPKIQLIDTAPEVLNERRHSHSGSLNTVRTSSASKSTSTLRPRPEELFASLWAFQGSPRSTSPSRFDGVENVGTVNITGSSEKTSFSPFLPVQSPSPRLDSTTSPRISSSFSYEYDPKLPDARTALQLLPRDLNTDLEVKPWMVVMPRFVLDDLAVGMREWDKERLDIALEARKKVRQKSV